MASPTFAITVNTVNPGISGAEKRQTIITIDLGPMTVEPVGSFGQEPIVSGGYALGHSIWQSSENMDYYYPTVSGGVGQSFFPSRRETYFPVSGNVYNASGFPYVSVHGYSYSGGGVIFEYSEELVIKIDGGYSLSHLQTVGGISHYFSYAMQALELNAAAKAAFSGFYYPLPTHLETSGGDVDRVLLAIGSLDQSKHVLNVNKKFDMQSTSTLERYSAFGPIGSRLFKTSISTTLRKTLYYDQNGNKYFPIVDTYQEYSGGPSGLFIYIPDKINIKIHTADSGTAATPASKVVTVYYFDKDSLYYTAPYPNAVSIGSESFAVSPVLIDTDGATYWIWGYDADYLQTLTPTAGAVMCAIYDPDHIVRNRPVVPTFPVEPIPGYGSFVPGVLAKY